jgi:hypothetical protein
MLSLNSRVFCSRISNNFCSRMAHSYIRNFSLQPSCRHLVFPPKCLWCKFVVLSSLTRSNEMSFSPAKQHTFWHVLGYEGQCRCVRSKANYGVYYAIRQQNLKCRYLFFYYVKLCCRFSFWTIFVFKSSNFCFELSVVEAVKCLCKFPPSRAFRLFRKLAQSDY